MHRPGIKEAVGNIRSTQKGILFFVLCVDLMFQKREHYFVELVIFS